MKILIFASMKQFFQFSTLRKAPLLLRIVVAIFLGIVLGMVLPLWAVRMMATFSQLFSNFLQFLIPFIIIGLVTPAIADIGKGAGRLLFFTALLAYLDTVFAGSLSYMTSISLFPSMIGSVSGAHSLEQGMEVAAYFNISIPPLMDVMTALITAFMVGLGLASFRSPALKRGFEEFKSIVVGTIECAIIPLLPIYICSIFIAMTYTGTAWHVLQVFVSIILVIFALHIFLLLFQYFVAGLLVRRNPMSLLGNMMPAYFTGLGTSSSAATIPVTLKQTLKNGVSQEVAGFVVPLCATIHLSGSALKITACAVALMLMQDMPFTTLQFVGFILMLGIMMVAAPGVPGGAIMAALGVLASMLGFGQDEQAMMIALYIAMDSFGTACNVTGDGAIALVVERFFHRKTPAHGVRV